MMKCAVPNGLEDILPPLVGRCSSDNDLNLNSVVVVVVVVVSVVEGKHWLEPGKLRAFL